MKPYPHSDQALSFFAKIGLLTLVSGLLLVAAYASPAESGTIKGTVYTTSKTGGKTSQSFVLGAILTLTNKAALDQSLKTTTNASGDFAFDNLAAGNYSLQIEAPGMASTTKDLRLDSGQMLVVRVDLTAAISESVTVDEEEGLLSTSDTTTSNVVRVETIKMLPLRTDSYQNAIQLTPGAIRDRDGNDYIKGASAGQSAYTVNGVDVTDPATGKLAFDIPLEASQSVQIQENPYSAEFGKFSGGVTNLQTKGGGDKFKVSLARFFPTTHNVFSKTVDSFRPRITFSGPVIKHRLNFLQSLEYRFSRSYVPNLPKPDNNVVQEGLNSFTQLDLTVNKNNLVRFNAAVFRDRFDRFGLDTFNTAPVTRNYKQRGILLSLAEQAVFKNASFLSSTISYKTFNVVSAGRSNAPFSVIPDGNTGAYFADTTRHSKRVEWQETYYARPFKYHGEHSVTAGIEYDHTQTAALFNYRPIFIRRPDLTLAQRIDFTSGPELRINFTDADAFVQDKWTTGERLTLEFGIRLDRDGITHSSNPAPRASFLFTPFRDKKTVLRGGIGLFYDRSLSTSGYFDREAGSDLPDPVAEPEQVPERTVTTFAANGITVVDGPRTFDDRLVSPLRTPRNIRWNLQVERAITNDLTARVGFMERRSSRELIVDPIQLSATTGNLQLSSTGHSRYDELQFLFVYKRPKIGEWNASYVYSRARGDLNTASQFFSDSPGLVVRQNEYGPLPFDVPHHLLVYGQIEVSKKHEIQFTPLVEMRSGFPFSNVNATLDFVGPRNEAGRFPTYFSFDFQVTKRIPIPKLKDRHVRLGIGLLNVTNHFNPRDVQNNISSPNYGRFYNSLGPAVKAKLDFGF
ncbi:MAG: TonB-dependent receptor [Acidobacteria bacterium]|nr:TonB-dependent receptor [Acidobacteriota bacterium]